MERVPGKPRVGDRVREVKTCTGPQALPVSTRYVLKLPNRQDLL